VKFRVFNFNSDQNIARTFDGEMDLFHVISHFWRLDSEKSPRRPRTGNSGTIREVEAAGNDWRKLKFRRAMEITGGRGTKKAPGSPECAVFRVSHRVLQSFKSCRAHQTEHRSKSVATLRAKTTVSAWRWRSSPTFLRTRHPGKANVRSRFLPANLTSNSSVPRILTEAQIRS
jgi:hypothetical protein